MYQNKTLFLSLILKKEYIVFNDSCQLLKIVEQNIKVISIHG